MKKVHNIVIPEDFNILFGDYPNLLFSADVADGLCVNVILHSDESLTVSWSGRVNGSYIYIGNPCDRFTWEPIKNLHSMQIVFPFYIMLERNDEVHFIKVHDSSQVDTISVSDYVTKKYLPTEDPVLEEVGKAYDKYDLLRAFYVNPDISVLPRYKHGYKTIDVEGRPKYISYLYKFVGFNITIDEKDKYWAREPLLALATNVSMKEYSVSGNYEHLTGSEYWTITLEDGLELRVEWKHELPAGTKEYHGCEVVYETSSYTSASMVCNKE